MDQIHPVVPEWAGKCWGGRVFFRVHFPVPQTLLQTSSNCWDIANRDVRDCFGLIFFAWRESSEWTIQHYWSTYLSTNRLSSSMVITSTEDPKTIEDAADTSNTAGVLGRCSAHTAGKKRRTIARIQHFRAGIWSNLPTKILEAPINSNAIIVSWWVKAVDLMKTYW